MIRTALLAAAAAAFAAAPAAMAQVVVANPSALAQSGNLSLDLGANLTGNRGAGESGVDARLGVQKTGSPAIRAAAGPNSAPTGASNPTGTTPDGRFIVTAPNAGNATSTAVNGDIKGNPRVIAGPSHP